MASTPPVSASHLPSIPSAAAATSNATAARDDLTQALRERGATGPEIQGVINNAAAPRSSGMTSLREIADELTRRAVLTLRGGRWCAETVQAIIGLPADAAGARGNCALNPG